MADSMLELNMIDLFKLMKINRLETWRMANLIYNGCMNKPDKRNGGRVSGICRAVNKSRFLKLEGGIIYFDSKGFIK